MIHIMKYSQHHHRNDLVKVCQDYGDFQRVRSLFRKQKVMQEIVTGSFSFGITEA